LAATNYQEKCEMEFSRTIVCREISHYQVFGPLGFKKTTCPPPLSSRIFLNATRPALLEKSDSKHLGCEKEVVITVICTQKVSLILNTKSVHFVLKRCSLWKPVKKLHVDYEECLS
jgi:hypothetical protein